MSANNGTGGTVKDVYYDGTVIWFDNRSGYGFIQWYVGAKIQEDMFVHFSDISCEGFKTLKKGQKVRFAIGANNRNVPKAIDVTVVA